MYKAILTTLALVIAASSSFALTTTKSKKHRHPVTAASSTHVRKHTATGVKEHASGTRAQSAKASTRRKGKLSRGASRSYQAAPTADRYKEIQQALANKGYFKDEPDGQWGVSSGDALKRFQADQNLMPDGKINSLSLIALGLGPKRLTAKSDGTSASQPAASPVTTAPPQ